MHIAHLLHSWLHPQRQAAAVARDRFGSSCIHARTPHQLHSSLRASAAAVSHRQTGCASTCLMISLIVSKLCSLSPRQSRSGLRMSTYVRHPESGIQKGLSHDLSAALLHFYMSQSTSSCQACSYGSQLLIDQGFPQQADQVSIRKRQVRHWSVPRAACLHKALTHVACANSKRRLITLAQQSCHCVGVLALQKSVSPVQRRSALACSFRKYTILH